MESGSKNWHDKYYKKLLILPALLIIFSFVYISIFYSNTGDFFKKDISLTGGTSVTLYGNFDSVKLETDLGPNLDGVKTREIYDLITREKQAVIIETRSDGDTTKSFLESYLGYELTSENSSFEFTGSSLSQSFFKQLMLALLFGFILMSLVVFLIFRNFVPSMAVIISALADIIMSVALINLLQLEISSAGIVALLMLIGYSVDTDILLTNRVLKGSHQDSLNSKLYGAFKTGMTMTLTAILSIGIALIVVKSFSVVLTQIFTIILIGLFFDLINTWITNVSLLKWYVMKKTKHEN